MVNLPHLCSCSASHLYTLMDWYRISSLTCVAPSCTLPDSHGHAFLCTPPSILVVPFLYTPSLPPPPSSNCLPACWPGTYNFLLASPLPWLQKVALPNHCKIYQAVFDLQWGKDHSKPAWFVLLSQCPRCWPPASLIQLGRTGGGIISCSWLVCFSEIPFHLLLPSPKKCCHVLITICLQRMSNGAPFLWKSLGSFNKMVFGLSRVASSQQ